MIKYLLVDYGLLLDDHGEDFLDSVIVKLLNPIDPDEAWEQEYHQLAREEHFKEMLQSLLGFINEETLKWNEVKLVAMTPAFFTEVLPEEFRKRDMEMLFVL